MHTQGFYKTVTDYTLETQLSLEWAAKRISELVGKGSICELGIGFGECTHGLSRISSRHIIVEASEEVIDAYKDKYPGEECTTIVKAFFEDFETDERFDCIIMGFILEHVNEPDNILRRFSNFLAPKGKLIVTVPNAKSLHRRIGHELGLLPDICSLSDYDRAAGHKHYYDLDSIKSTLEGVGYKICHTEGLMLKPITATQMHQLGFGEQHVKAFLKLGVEYPEIANSILIVAEK